MKFSLAAVILMVLVPARLVLAAPVESFLQQELKQQQLKATTERVGQQLDAIVDEFNRNGIAGQDVTVLRTIRNVLGTLSEKDMQLVVEPGRVRVMVGGSAATADAYTTVTLDGPERTIAPNDRRPTTIEISTT